MTAPATDAEHVAAWIEHRRRDGWDATLAARALRAGMLDEAMRMVRERQ